MPPVQSVVRSVLLLEEVAKRPLGLVDLAAAVDLPTTTTARLLATLVEVSALHREDDGTYRIGPTITSLALAGDLEASLCALSRPHMVELAAAVGESVGLSLPAGDEVVTIAQVDAQRSVQAEDWSGSRWPLHLGGSGDVLLAGWPDDEVAAWLARFGEAGPVRTRIEHARATGVAWSHGDYVDDLSSVAAAVCDADDRAIAALYVYGPSYRFPGEAGTELVEARVREHADRISAAWSARRREADAA